MTKETSWIKQVETAVKGAQLVPMLGTIPSFPKEGFEAALKQSLGLDHLSVEMANAQWRQGDEVTEGFGQNVLQTAIQLSPLQGSCSLIIGSEDFDKLSKFLVDNSGKKVQFLDPFLQKGFFKYLCLQSLSAVTETGYLQNLSPKLVDMPFVKETAYCVDLDLRIKKTHVWARLLIPAMLQQNLNTHFADSWSYQMESDLYSSIKTPVSLNIGDVKLSMDEWSSIKTGDLLMLDHSSFNPETGKGLLKMQLGQTPLMLVKLKQNKLKIIDHAFYAEENTMDSLDDEQSPFAEQTPPSENPPLEANEPPSEEALNSEPEAAPKAKAPKPVAEKLVAPNKVPLTLNVEATKINLTLEQLLALKPGNILETELTPDTQVNLTLEGKTVAKGVLIQYGDVTGVKITKLG
jgi:flagellar motor switch protein FliN